MKRPVISPIYDIAESLDRLITVDICVPYLSRGSIVPLYEAALALVGKPLTLAAAKALQRTCSEDKWVIISTGFVLHPYLPHGETDGPIGAAALARALNKAFGSKILLLTEKEVVEPLRRSLLAAGLFPHELEVAERIPQAIAIRTFPVATEQARREAAQICRRLDPVAMITVEKCGRNIKGVYHTSPGSDMSRWTAKVDHLFDLMREEKRLTIGIGDYGNEIGMGALVSAVKEIAPTARKCNCPCNAGIATIVEADVPLVASISNWGAYGIIACLAAMLGDFELLHKENMEQRMIEQCCLAGCGDGSTVKPSFSVDGISVHGHKAMVRLLREVIKTKTEDKPFIRD